jgi:hypothetical protein
MANKHLKIYIINDKYILYLSSFDSRIYHNKNGKRPYLGIVIDLKDIKYFVPMVSPKKKHKKMKNNLDFHKIEGGKYGALNFNAMIPVGNEDYNLMDFSSLEKYRVTQMNDQLKWFQLNKDLIIQKANNIRHRFLNNSLPKPIKERCLNFIILEEKLKEWIISSKK